MIRRTITKERVIRTLLNNHLSNNQTPITKYRLAKLSEMGYSTFSRIFDQLQKEGFVEDTKVIDFIGLISKWSDLYYITPIKREYLIKNPIDFLKNANLEYSLTTYQAENRIQNFLFTARTDFWINPSDFFKWHETIITNNGLVGKGNTRIFMRDKHALYNSTIIDGLKIVSLPQLIADLFNERGVGIEAANMLLERILTNALSKV